jgi:hypothetical protein
MARHLPGGGPFALRDYGALGAVRHRWYVTLGSALIGAGSHLLWDGFTHSPQTSGWGAVLIPALETEALAGLPWYRLFQHVSSAVGALLAIAMLARIGRNRLIAEWHGPAPEVTGRPVLFWTVAAVVLVGYPLSWPYLTHLHQPHVQGTRLLCFTALGLLAGAAATALADVRSRRAARAGR